MRLRIMLVLMKRAVAYLVMWAFNNSLRVGDLLAGVTI